MSLFLRRQSDADVSSVGGRWPRIPGGRHDRLDTGIPGRYLPVAIYGCNCCTEVPKVGNCVSSSQFQRLGFEVKSRVERLVSFLSPIHHIHAVLPTAHGPQDPSNVWSLIATRMNGSCVITPVLQRVAVVPSYTLLRQVASACAAADNYALPFCCVSSVDLRSSSSMLAIAPEAMSSSNSAFVISPVQSKCSRKEGTYARTDPTAKRIK